MIGEKIASILEEEQENQQALAIADGKPDPTLWKLRIFRERENPISVFQKQAPLADTSPVVHVNFESANSSLQGSTLALSQKDKGYWHIDCYGYAISKGAGAGHDAGDKLAALEAQRAVRLVRNILMHPAYQQLGLQGVVMTRFPEGPHDEYGKRQFQPTGSDGQPVSNVIGLRFTLAVTYNEFPVENIPENLEVLFLEVKDETGSKVLAEIEKT